MLVFAVCSVRTVIITVDSLPRSVDRILSSTVTITFVNILIY